MPAPPCHSIRRNNSCRAPSALMRSPSRRVKPERQNACESGAPKRDVRRSAFRPLHGINCATALASFAPLSMSLSLCQSGSTPGAMHAARGRATLLRCPGFVCPRRSLNHARTYFSRQYLLPLGLNERDTPPFRAADTTAHFDDSAARYSGVIITVRKKRVRQH